MPKYGVEIQLVSRNREHAEVNYEVGKTRSEIEDLMAKEEKPVGRWQLFQNRVSGILRRISGTGNPESVLDERLTWDEEEKDDLLLPKQAYLNGLQERITKIDPHIPYRVYEGRTDYLDGDES